MEGVFQVLSGGEEIAQEEKRAAAAAPGAAEDEDEKEAGDNLSEAEGSAQTPQAPSVAAPEPPKALVQSSFQSACFT